MNARIPRLALALLLAPAALAHEPFSLPQPGRAPALTVSQGAGVGLPGVLAALAGKPHQPWALFVEAGGQAPLLLTGGVLGGDGMLQLSLALPGEVLALPLVFRAAVLEDRRPHFSPDAPLQLGVLQDCRIEDWEDHDCGTGAGCEEGDGDSASLPGQIVTCQWEDEWGCVSAVNDSPDGPHHAVIFDSAAPTGGDLDLATPVADPGTCEDPDGFTTPPPLPDPCAEYGHVLIVQEDDDGCGDGFCDEPDDEGWGGTLVLHFDLPLVVCSLDLLDVDDPGGATVRTFCESCDEGNQELHVPPGSDGSLVRVFLEPRCVSRLEVEFAGSGALAEWRYDFCPIDEDG